MSNAYIQLKKELNTELIHILNYWSSNTLDHSYGGFLGKIDHYNRVVPKASKGIILNSRILWSFSAASIHLKANEYKGVCDRAYAYLKTYFIDETHKGVYWELDYEGNPINKRKQVYAQAFTIYALSEYYMFSKNEDAKIWAIEIFELLEKYAKDDLNLGYYEAFNESWNSIQDMRLSDKDMNASKTMNTHLHVLEAYTTLLKVYDTSQLRASLRQLVELFFEKFLNANNHFDLFFDDHWNLLGNSVSYGHDIEAAWLIIEAAKQINDEELLNKANKLALKIADTFLEEAIDREGAVINEKNLDNNRIDTDRHWWPQVEALIGLNYAYNLKNEKKYIECSLKIWEFTKKYLVDHKNGEWFFRVDENGKPYIEEDKVSMWKAPYHTSRAFIILNS